jgi:hypothetical protein
MRHMFSRRRLFEIRLGTHPERYSEDEMRTLWDEADIDAWTEVS